MSRLPAGITIGQFISAFNLEITSSLDGPEDTPEQGISGCAIHIMRLGEEEHVLPFPGCEIQLTLRDRTLLLQINPSPLLENRFPHPKQQTRIYLSRPESPWADFCSQAAGWLEQQQGRVLAGCEEYFQMIIQTLSDQHGQSVVDTLKTILDCDVLLLDNQSDVLDWAGGRRLPEKPIAFFAPGMPATSATASSGPATLVAGRWKGSFQDSPLTWCPLAGQQGVLGYLGLAVAVEDIGSVERYFLQRTVAFLTLELVKNQCIKENERQHHRDFLFDLLYNNFDSLEVICSRGKLWGWDFSKPHLVAVGELEDFTPLPAERERLVHLVDQALSATRSLYHGAICLERNEQIVLLFPLQDLIAPSRLAATAEHLLQPIWEGAGAMFAGRKLFFGLGNLYPTAREIHRSFQEARSALELGRLLYPDQLLTSFRELGIMRLLQGLDHQELEDFRLETLKQLLESDRDGNLDLEQTLLTYFLCSGDLNQAAEKLFVHPNTVRYRLKKAAEVLDLDISRLTNQLNLFIALQVGCLKDLWSE